MATNNTKMKYIIMAGGDYQHWEKPRHLSVINGEVLIARTIRLLRENGITDIAISSTNPIFEQFGVPVLKHDNVYVTRNWTIEKGDWFNAFYPTDEPTCYIFGDVYFSDEAIKKIIETETDDIEFFGSKPPFADNYIKDHEEPFALKVVNTQHLKDAVNKTRELDKAGAFWRKPIMWELWTVIKDAPLQKEKGIYPVEYTVINDYTCDIDWKGDIKKLELKIGGKKMVKVEALSDFSLRKFNEIKNLQRKARNTVGMIYTGDIFECDDEMADYLTGNNARGKAVVKVLEILPDKDVKVVYHEEEKPTHCEFVKINLDEEKPKKETTKKPRKKKASVK